MASKFTIHNGLESDNVNAPINVTTGLQIDGLSVIGATGTARFVNVDSTAGDGDGQSLGTAFASLQAAIDVAQPHDVLIVYPGTYEENLVVTTDYLTIVGAQSGYGRPDVSAAAGVTLTVTAQGFRCARMRFASGDGSDAVLQEGNGFAYDDCVFDDASDVGAAGVRLKGNADDDSFTASEGTISGCLVRGNAVGICFDTGDAPGNGVGCTHDVVSSCRFIGNLVDLATQDTGGGVYSIQTSLITDCRFLDKNKAVYIDFTSLNGGAAGDQSGSIQDCYFATDAITTTNIAIVGTEFTVVGCYDTVGVQDGSGLD